MSVLDIIILIFLLIGAINGYRKGFLMEVISLSAFFIAIILGIKLLDWGIATLSTYIAGYDHVIPVIAFAMIFIVVIGLMNLLGKAVKRVLDMTLLGGLDDLAGAVMGVLKWALFISIFFWIYESFGGSLSNHQFRSSYLYEPISAIAPGLFRLFSGLYPMFMELFDHSKELVDQPELNT